MTQFESTYLELLTAWHAGELNRALVAARALQQIAPDYFPAAVYRAILAMTLNRPAEMIEAAENVVRDVPPMFAATRRGGETALLEAYRDLGEYDKLLALAQQVRRERPGDTGAFVHEARALAALGRLDELHALIGECQTTPGGQCDAARVQVEAAWYLEAYEHHQRAIDYANSAIAEYQKIGEQDPRFLPTFYLFALRAAERWDEYRTFAARCVEERPDDPELQYYRCCVGMAAAHLGDRDAAETIARQLEADGIDDLAGYIAAHLGERDRALELIRRGLAESDITYRRIRRWDLDMQPLWGYPPFEELIRPKG
jgi:tetratricopeptide (TPR) repeat protein